MSIIFDLDDMNFAECMSGSLYFWNILLSPIFLLISNLINSLCLHQFLGTKTTEANKSLKLQKEPINKITNEQKDKA